jgi:hypothetical protein
MLHYPLSVPIASTIAAICVRKVTGDKVAIPVDQKTLVCIGVQIVWDGPSVLPRTVFR